MWAAVERVLTEGSDLCNVRPIIGEAMSTFGELRVLLRIHRRKKVAAEKQEVERKLECRQTEMESTKNSPQAWKTPAEPDEVISGSSLEEGSQDSELSWVGTVQRSSARGSGEK